MRMWIASAAGLAALACGNTGPVREAAVRTDSSGIEIVTSSVTDRPLSWQFERVAAIGGANEGPGAFFDVSRAGVAFGPGRIVVLDVGNRRVGVFSEAGEAIRSIAREGGGPGELRFPSSVSVDSSGIITVHDFGHRALIRFDSSGTYLGQKDAPAGVSGPIRPNGGASVFATRRRDAETDLTTIRLLQAAGQDTVELMQAPVPGTRSVLYESCGVSISLPPLFSDPPSWDAQGGRVAVSSVPEYTVRIFDNGSEVRHIRRPIPPEAATKQAALREFGEGEDWTIGNRKCTVPAEELIEQRGFAEVVPTISKVAVAPDGTVWVERQVLGEETGPVDVFDAAGAYVGTLPPATPWPVAFGSGDRILVIETDDLDVQRVVIYRIVRG